MIEALRRADLSRQPDNTAQYVYAPEVLDVYAATDEEIITLLEERDVEEGLLLTHEDAAECAAFVGSNEAIVPVIGSQLGHDVRGTYKSAFTPLQLGAYGLHFLHCIEHEGGTFDYVSHISRQPVQTAIGQQTMSDYTYLYEMNCIFPPALKTREPIQYDLVTPIGLNSIGYKDEQIPIYFTKYIPNMMELQTVVTAKAIDDHIFPGFRIADIQGDSEIAALNKHITETTYNAYDAAFGTGITLTEQMRTAMFYPISVMQAMAVYYKAFGGRWMPEFGINAGDFMVDIDPETLMMKRFSLMTIRSLEEMNESEWVDQILTHTEFDRHSNRAFKPFESYGEEVVKQCLDRVEEAVMQPIRN